MNQSPLNRGALARIGLLALIWGSSFLWIKLADRDFSAVEVTLGRLASGAAMTVIIFAGACGCCTSGDRHCQVGVALIPGC